MFFMRTEIVAQYGKDNERDWICKKEFQVYEEKYNIPLKGGMCA